MWLGRILGWLVLLVLAMALGGAIYQWLASARDARKYPPTGELFDVGGHKLHLHCEGEGRPTVLLETGLGADSLAWSWIQPEVARLTRVCSYDRAGFGWSEPGPTPRESRQIVKELRTALDRAGIDGPFVLVGHSIGGYHVRVFADRYPREVVGMVLVDASHEDQRSRMPEELAKFERVQSLVLSACRFLAPFGVMRLAGLTFLNIEGVPAEVKPAIDAHVARTDYCRGVAQEFAAFDASADQVRATGTLGEKRLVVITAGALVSVEDVPPGLTTETIEKMTDVWLELQKELVTLSSNATHIIAEEATHLSLATNREHARAVIDAIRQLVEESRVNP